MTREEFFDLAQRVSAFAQQRPRRYRLAVTMFAVLGYTVLFGAMALCAGLLVFGGLSFTQDWFWRTVGVNARFTIAWIGFLIGLATTLYALVRSLFVHLPAPSGLRVQRTDAPELFALIDEVVTASEAPPPHTVLLTWDFNAAVTQQPRFGWLNWWTRDYLILGVPLMAAMTPLQFKAVLAHEFGHLRGGHSRFANWVYRLRLTWDQTLARLARQRRKSAHLLARFLRWYAPRFSAYTHALARAQEFEADRWAAQVAGLPATGEAFVTLWTRAEQMQEQFWQPLHRRSTREADVPRGVSGPLLTLLGQPVPPEDRQRWLRAALSRVTDGTDTHPSPTERFAALGLPTTLDAWEAHEAQLQAAGSEGGTILHETSAARALLGARLDQHLGELETGWRTFTGPAWRQRFQHARAARARLETLQQQETNSPTGELPEAAAWERARLEIDLAATPAEATATAERFVSRWPGHAAGRFCLGRLLLGADHPAGIEHLEEAVRLDGRLAAEGEEAIAAFLRRTGQAEEAAARRRLAVRHGDVLDAAHAERRNITAKDRFLPHGLDETVLANLREQLAARPRVWKVYLARKEVVHHSEQPWYVMVCIIKWRWNEYGSSPKRVQAALNEVRRGLTIAGDNEFYFYLTDHRHRRVRLVRRLQKIPGAEVFPLPKLKGRRKWWGGREKVATPIPPAARPSEIPPPLPPPLPVAARVMSPGPARRREVLAVAVSLLVVACPLAFVVYNVLQRGDAWQRLHAALDPGRVFAPLRAGMMAEARAPIPRHPQATTMEDDRRATLAWARRTMLGGFDRAGHHNAHWNAAARAFIENALPWWAGLHDCTTGAADLLPQARNVLHLGCDDPLVLYLAALAEERADRQSAVAGPMFTRAVLGFQNTAYARGVAMIAAAELVADCERRRDGTGESDPVKQWWLLWFKQALRDGSFTPDEQTVLSRCVCLGVGSNLFQEYRDSCCQAIDDAGDQAVAPWLRLALSGKRYVRDAWAARGGDYAANVTAEGWRGFAKGLASARRDLIQSWRLNPQRPEAAALMISVALGQETGGSDGTRAWFDRAVSAQFDYEPAYDRFTTALLPQWGGSEEAMLAFGLNCAATEAYDTGVPMQLNEAVSSVDAPRGYGNPQVYSALERMFAGYEAAPSQVGRRVVFHNCHARAAELTGRYPDAYRLLKEVNFVLSPEMAAELARKQADGNYLERIAAYGGAGGTDAQMGDHLIERGRPDAALARFRAALAVEGGDPRAVKYLRSRLGKLETEQELANGNWISFQPAAGPGGVPVGWTSKLGVWRVAADGALIGQAGASGSMLVNDVKVGRDFEMRGELDFLPGAPGEEQTGVVFGHPDMESEDWQSFRLKRNGPEGAIATISCHWHDGPKRSVAVPNHNAFVLQSWHGLITLTINGEVVFRGQRLDEGQVNDDSGVVGLGGYAHHGNSFAVAYRKLQLRRLTNTPLAQN